MFALLNTLVRRFLSIPILIGAILIGLPLLSGSVSLPHDVAAASIAVFLSHVFAYWNAVILGLKS